MIEVEEKQVLELLEKVEKGMKSHEEICKLFYEAIRMIPRWIPVSERLPDRMMQCVCQYVFGDNTEYPFYAVMWYFANGKVPHFQNEGSMGLRVIHWMPLPEPPKENADEVH